MKEKVIKSLQRRFASEISSRNPLKYLSAKVFEDKIDDILSTLYLYTRPKKGKGYKSICFVEIACALGHSLRTKMKLPLNSSLAAKTGAFILYTFEELNILCTVLGQGKNGHATYIIKVLDDKSIVETWNKLPTREITKLPSEKPYDDWVTTRHSTGLPMVKTGNKEVLSIIKPETHPIIFNCLNKAQKVGWLVNYPVYKLQDWSLKKKSDAFSNIWTTPNKEAKTTRLREAKAILSIAKRFVGKTFYHIYYYDFRGRKYPNTTYLHEQGSDTARGLLLRADCKPIGREGFYWLMVSIATNWAGNAGSGYEGKTDKIPLKQRYLWAMENEELFLSYAEKPKVNQGWMQADKPWQFIAACMELYKLRIWQYSHGNPENPFDDFSYSSHLEAFIDGSNNGYQHLAALTKDEVTAAHVNLVPLRLPGDLYMYVARHVWKNIENEYNKIPKEEVEKCNEFIDKIIDVKKKITKAEPRSDERKELLIEVKNLRKKSPDKCAIVFWNRIVDDKQKRKIVKRNVMTVSYGGTAYGMGNQQINDSKKHGIDLLLHMEHSWGAYLGRSVYDDCKIALKRPMQLLSIFEKAGKRAEERGEFLSWNVPITNFPVVQNYTEGICKKIYIQYGPQKGLRTSTGYFENTLQCVVCFIENTKPSKGKQAQGAAPNVVHSFDGAHLVITIDKADYPVTTIHDSFGCLLADMPKLFKLIRETFVDFYKSDPLSSVMKDIGGDMSKVQIGTLDLNSVKSSEYCFS